MKKLRYARSVHVMTEEYASVEWETGSDIEVYCPSCNESHIFMDARFGFKYCQDCGQKLDWSDK